jgi:hypothetical protein
MNGDDRSTPWLSNAHLHTQQAPNLSLTHNLAPGVDAVQPGEVAIHRRPPLVLQVECQPRSPLEHVIHL